MEHQITGPVRCSECGRITYEGETEYTCDGCGSAIPKKSMGVTFHLKPGDVYRKLLFCDSECFVDFITNLPDEEIEKVDFTSINFNSRELKSFRDALNKKINPGPPLEEPRFTFL